MNAAPKFHLFSFPAAYYTLHWQQGRILPWCWQASFLDSLYYRYCISARSTTWSIRRTYHMWAKQCYRVNYRCWNSYRTAKTWVITTPKYRWHPIFTAPFLLFWTKEVLEKKSIRVWIFLCHPQRHLRTSYTVVLQVLLRKYKGCCFATLHSGVGEQLNRSVRFQYLYHKLIQLNYSANVKRFCPH